MILESILMTFSLIRGIDLDRPIIMEKRYPKVAAICIEAYARAVTTNFSTISLDSLKPGS